MSNTPHDDPERRTLELEKLRAETAKLSAEAAALLETTRLSSEVENVADKRERFQAESGKLSAETIKAKEEASKLRREASRSWLILEYLKAFGAFAAFVIALVALLTFMGSMRKESSQRADEIQKQADVEFSKALDRIGEADVSHRLVGVISLKRFLDSGYERYHGRAIDALVFRLRFEADPGIRSVIEKAAIDLDKRALVPLIAVRQLIRFELVPLFDPPPGESRIPIEQDRRRALLQAAFLSASRAAARIDGTSLDLSKGLLGRARLEHQDLRGAKLDEASLYEADLYHADLRGATLRNADLARSSLRGASLGGADLWCADVSGTDASGAVDVPIERMSGSNWRDGKFDREIRRRLEEGYPMPQGTSQARRSECPVRQ